MNPGDQQSESTKTWRFCHSDTTDCFHRSGRINFCANVERPIGRDVEGKRHGDRCHAGNKLPNRSADPRTGRKNCESRAIDPAGRPRGERHDARGSLGAPTIAPSSRPESSRRGRQAPGRFSEMARRQRGHPSLRRAAGAAAQARELRPLRTPLHLIGIVDPARWLHYPVEWASKTR